ncbi:hypothetical protein [Niameybacter sp.]|uniref:hypothetical protein n=1 Tax=Niameybacter sp. TaxID=2033640 RepID=UPI002FCAFE00
MKLELRNPQGQLVASEWNTIDASYKDLWHFPQAKRIMQPDKDWQSTHPEAYANDNKFEARYIAPPIHKLEAQEVYSASIEMDIDKPALWDAEHPHLYTLSVSLWQNEVMRQEQGMLSYKLYLGQL